MSQPSVAKQTAPAQQQSWGKLITLGIQHVFAMFGSTVLVPILTGLDTFAGAVCAGLGTMLLPSGYERKVPAFLGSRFAFISAIQTVASMIRGRPSAPRVIRSGLQYACGGIIVAGALYLVLALLVKLVGAERVRAFFPPVVTGPIMMIIGLMLAPTAINNIVTANGLALAGTACGRTGR